MKKFAIYIMLLFASFAYSSLDDLATALEQLALDSSDFLGQWMVQNRPKDLITYADNFANTGIPVYQIKVLKQWEGDCWIHAFRNCLYFMDLLSSPRDQFDMIYQNMVSRNQYDAFTRYGCPKQGTVTREFLEGQLSCRPECIPQDSLEYLKNILTFKYEPEFSAQQFNKATKVLTEREGSTPTTEEIFGYTLVTIPFNLQESNLPRFIEILHNFRTKNSYTAGFSVLSDYTNHETTVVINKKDGKFECLFSDSNNMSFKGDNRIVQTGNTRVYFGVNPNEYNNITRSFREQIKQILYWIQDPNAFNNLAVRALYDQMKDNFYLQKEYNIKKFGLKNWQQQPDFAVELLGPLYNNLEKYNLLDNDLYQSVYKKLYCDLIKKEQSDQNKGKEYTELLKKVDCYKNKEAYDDLEVRTFYEEMKDNFYRQKQHNIKNWQQIRTSDVVELLEPFYENLKKNKLLENSLYKSTYKKMYCDLIKQEQAVQKAFKSKDYNNLLKKVDC